MTTTDFASKLFQAHQLLSAALSANNDLRDKATGEDWSSVLLRSTGDKIVSAMAIIETLRDQTGMPSGSKYQIVDQQGWPLQWKFDSEADAELFLISHGFSHYHGVPGTRWEDLLPANRWWSRTVMASARGQHESIPLIVMLQIKEELQG